jgi:hypothetical protein
MNLIEKIFSKALLNSTFRTILIYCSNLPPNKSDLL